VTATSDAMTLQETVFKRSPRAITLSLKRSAEKSHRRMSGLRAATIGGKLGVRSRGSGQRLVGAERLCQFRSAVRDARAEAVRALTSAAVEPVPR
jgi:hypothetical protein